MMDTQIKGPFPKTIPAYPKSCFDNTEDITDTHICYYLPGGLPIVISTDKDRIHVLTDTHEVVYDPFINDPYARVVRPLDAILRSLPEPCTFYGRIGTDRLHLFWAWWTKGPVDWQSFARIADNFGLPTADTYHGAAGFKEMEQLSETIQRIRQVGSNPISPDEDWKAINIFAVSHNNPTKAYWLLDH